MRRMPSLQTRRKRLGLSRDDSDSSTASCSSPASLFMTCNTHCVNPNEICEACALLLLPCALVLAVEGKACHPTWTARHCGPCAVLTISLLQTTSTSEVCKNEARMITPTSKLSTASFRFICLAISWHNPQPVSASEAATQASWATAPTFGVGKSSEALKVKTCYQFENWSRKV